VSFLTGGCNIYVLPTNTWHLKRKNIGCMYNKLVVLYVLFGNMISNVLSDIKIRGETRAVASMYSWGGGGGGGGGVRQKFPNDEKNFRIFHGVRS
jgi:hypothetical protein